MSLLNVLTVVNSCCNSVSSLENSFKTSIYNKRLALYFALTLYHAPWLLSMLVSAVSAEQSNNGDKESHLGI